MNLANFKDEVLDLVEELVNTIQLMREEGESDLRSVIHHIEDLRMCIVRLEEQGDYLNG